MKACYSFSAFAEDCMSAVEAVKQCFLMPCAYGAQEDAPGTELLELKPQHFQYLLQPLGECLSGAGCFGLQLCAASTAFASYFRARLGFHAKFWSPL